MTDTKDVMPEPISQQDAWTPEEMLARLQRDYGTTATAPAAPADTVTVADDALARGDETADDQITAPRESSTPAAAPDQQSAPAGPATDADGGTRATTRRSTTPPRRERRTPAAGAEPGRTVRTSCSIPASIYTAARAAATRTGMSLTHYALTAVNTHAAELIALFPPRAHTSGPIPLDDRQQHHSPRQRNEPAATMQLYLTADQLTALDGVTASSGAPSRSALIAEALARATGTGHG